MTRTEYYCPHCKNKDPISSSSDSCPACQRELPAPNVRAASSEEEVTKLQERVKRAEEETFARGCRAILEDFATAVAGLSFPPKTGPLFWHGKGICDGSETTFGRGHTEAAA